MAVFHNRISTRKNVERESKNAGIEHIFGIIVRMYRELGGKHNMPHIHAEYAEDEIVIALDGTILEGTLPKNRLKLLEAWMEIHREDLEANWKLLSNGEEFFRIDPLK